MKQDAVSLTWTGSRGIKGVEFGNTSSQALCVTVGFAGTCEKGLKQKLYV